MPKIKPMICALSWSRKVLMTREKEKTLNWRKVTFRDAL